MTRANSSRPADISVREIADRLADRCEDVCRQLLPLGMRRGDEWKEASKERGGLGDSLSVKLAGTKRGRWWHHAAGVTGDLLDLHVHLRGGDLAAAVAWAKSWLGIDDADPTDRRWSPPVTRPVHEVLAAQRAEEEKQAKRIRWALDIWKASIRADRTRTEAYLRGRGFEGPIPTSIRHHVALNHPDTGKPYPALVAAVQAPTGEISGVWRIYLDGRGGKADVPTPKLGLGVVKGGAVRLSARKPKLVVAEGIETALSLLRMWPDACVWACLSTSGMRGLVIPDWVEEVVIAEDHDPACMTPGPMYGLRPGEEAAKALQERLASLNPPLPCARLRPAREGDDFNDLVRGADSRTAEGGR